MNKNQQHTFTLIGFAAVLFVAAGGITVTVLRSSHTGESAVQSQDADGDTGAQIAPKLTVQTDAPGMHGLTQTDSGMFFTGTEIPLLDSKNRWDALKYYDAESGETVYLCARPNCLHDGDAFCPATTVNYTLLSDPVWLDGYVYAVAADNTEQLSQSNAKYRTVLLRYAADGTEITKVAELHAEPQSDTDSFAETEAVITAHRGQLWLACSYRISRQLGDPALDTANSEQFGGYELFAYEPDSEKLTRLAGTDTLIKNFIILLHGTELCGIGDDVYFEKWNADWQDPLKGDGFFRIDCRSGTIEQILKPGNGEVFGDYAVTPEAIVCRVTSTVHDDYEMIKRYSLSNGEASDLISVQEIVETQYPDWKPDRTGNPPFWMTGLLSNAEHVCVFWYYNRPETDGLSYYLTLLDHSGQIEQTVELPGTFAVTDADFVEQYLTDRQHDLHTFALTDAEIEEIQQNGVKDYFDYCEENLHITDGKLYLRGSYQEYMLPILDALSGSSALTPLYRFYTYH